MVVTGLAGSGKSTFSKRLAAATGLPLVHLDLEFWQPGWLEPSSTDWKAIEERALAGDEWIADGNYAETLELRVGLADTVVVLDTPWWRCVVRSIRRAFEMPDQLPFGCELSRWRRLRDELGVTGRIWQQRRSEPTREREIIDRHGRHAVRHTLTSRREVDAFLERLSVAQQNRPGREPA